MVSNAEASTAMQVNYYAKRWTIEPNFRDTKDLRFGIGLGATRVGEPTRRDRRLLINAFAMVLLTMLGARRKPRKGPIAQVQYVENPHALIVQAGLHALRTHPNQAGSQLSPLMARFAETVSKCRSFTDFSRSLEMRG